MIKLMQVGQVPTEEIFARVVPEVDVSAIVSDIISDVRKNGDDALYRYCEKFDHAKLSALEVSDAEFEEAFASMEPSFLDIDRKSVV